MTTPTLTPYERFSRSFIGIALGLDPDALNLCEAAEIRRLFWDWLCIVIPALVILFSMVKSGLLLDDSFWILLGILATLSSYMLDRKSLDENNMRVAGYLQRFTESEPRRGLLGYISLRFAFSITLTVGALSFFMIDFMADDIDHYQRKQQQLHKQDNGQQVLDYQQQVTSRYQEEANKLSDKQDGVLENITRLLTQKQALDGQITQWSETKTKAGHEMVVQSQGLNGAQAGEGKKYKAAELEARTADSQLALLNKQLDDLQKILAEERTLEQQLALQLNGLNITAIVKQQVEEYKAAQMDYIAPPNSYTEKVGIALAILKEKPLLDAIVLSLPMMILLLIKIMPLMMLSGNTGSYPVIRQQLMLKKAGEVSIANQESNQNLNQQLRQNLSNSMETLDPID